MKVSRLAVAAVVTAGVMVMADPSPAGAATPPTPAASKTPAATATHDAAAVASRSVHPSAADPFRYNTTPVTITGNAIVPNVTGWNLGAAINAVQAAGFAVEIGPGFVDCGLSYVQWQNPGGGTSAPIGSTVFLQYNQQPGPGQDCP